MSGFYGVGSDHAVSFDVVLANGKLVKADAKTNSDLFWALKGGGMGTFGVVISSTIKTYPVIPVTGMGLTITDTGDRFWEGVRIWHTMVSCNPPLHFHTDLIVLTPPRPQLTPPQACTSGTPCKKAPSSPSPSSRPT